MSQPRSPCYPGSSRLRIFSHVLKPNRINHFEKRELIEISIPGADLSNSVLAKQSLCARRGVGYR